MSESLVGKRVLVEFDTNRWPIHKATYIFEGQDQDGYWLRRKDGTQRYFLRADIASISLAMDQSDIPEAPH